MGNNYKLQTSKFNAQFDVVFVADTRSMASEGRRVLLDITSQEEEDLLVVVLPRVE